MMVVTARNFASSSVKNSCPPSYFVLRFLLLAVALLLHGPTNVTAEDGLGIVSETTKIEDEKTGSTLGVIRSHYDSSVASCSTVLFLGVGTFMSVTDYDKIAHHIVTAQPIVTIFLDQDVDDMMKTSAKKYANLINAVEKQIRTILPFCQEGADYIIGGHSASGQAAVEAWQLNLFESTSNLVGFVGLDPYDISSKTIDHKSLLNVPSLFWGFTEATCLVKPEKAARAAYELAESDARVLYTVDNHHGSEINHCVFTDQGCGIGPIGCPKRKGFEWIFAFVAESIHRFVHALHSPSKFTRSTFELDWSSPYDVELAVNEDEDISETTTSNDRTSQAASTNSMTF